MKYSTNEKIKKAYAKLGAHMAHKLEYDLRKQYEQCKTCDRLIREIDEIERKES